MILEAYVTSLVKKDAEIIENFSTSLNEASLATDITNFLKEKGITDPEVINVVLAALKSDVILKVITKIVDRVDKGNSALEKSLKASIDRMKAPIVDKVKFLRKISQESILKESMIFGTPSSIKLNDLEPLIDETKISDTIKDYIPLLIAELFETKTSKKGEGRTGVGRGEILLATLGNGSLGASLGGDIAIEKSGSLLGAEIKSGNGVISNLGGELFDVVKINNKVLTAKIKDLGLNLSIKDLGKKNFFKHYDKNPKEMYELLTLMFKERIRDDYPIADDIKKTFDTILTFDEKSSVMQAKFETFIKEIGKQIFEAYKEKEGWEYLIFLNEVKGKYVYGSFQNGNEPKFNLVGFLYNGGTTSPQLAIKG